MTAKFDAFKTALVKLCFEHEVTIEPSMYDNLVVYDREPGTQPIDLERLEDKTKEIGESLKLGSYSFERPHEDPPVQGAQLGYTSCAMPSGQPVWFRHEAGFPLLYRSNRDDGDGVIDPSIPGILPYGAWCWVLPKD